MTRGLTTEGFHDRTSTTPEGGESGARSGEGEGANPGAVAGAVARIPGTTGELIKWMQARTTKPHLSASQAHDEKYRMAYAYECGKWDQIVLLYEMWQDQSEEISHGRS